jgi:hypothetical protein
LATHEDDILLRTQHSLQRIQEKGGTIRFYNNYRGLPVNNDGRVSRVGFRVSSFTAPRVQLFCMMLNRGTFLVHPLLPGKLHARVMCLHFDTLSVDLGDFTLVDDSIGTRAFVRVAPEIPIQGFFAPGEGSKHTRPVNIDIIDLSLHGLAFVTEKVEGLPLAGKKTSIAYPLETLEGSQMISVNGVFMNTIQLSGPVKMRVGVNISPDANTERLLARYLASRQKELLKELKNFCDLV